MENTRKLFWMKKILNDLYDYPNMKIYQYDEGFKFSLDSILLAESVQLHKKDQLILDLCTGNAVVPLILSTKTNISIYGVEIQKLIYDLAFESITYNNRKDQINLIHDNVKNLNKYFPGNKFDIITCNPPYFKFHDPNFINSGELKQIARHEIEITLEDIIICASTYLKDKGNFYMVHISERLQEILFLLEQNKLRVKDLYLVYPKRNEKSFLVLFRAIKRGNLGLKIHKPIYLNELSTYQGIFEGSD